MDIFSEGLLNNTEKIKRAFLISDTHFGVRNNSREWSDMQVDYFENFFFPLLMREKKEGDVIIHCGDVFDSRHSLNILVMNRALEVFEKMSKILPVIIIVGNHDLYNVNTNDINSLKLLKWLPNIKIITEPEVLNFKDNVALFMPWRKSVDAEVECIENNPANYMFCHTNIRGLRYNRHTDIYSGLELFTLQQYKRAYSGHIHFTQEIDNFRMLGCPYQLTRSDIGNKKGVFMIDFETDTEQYWENDYSPKFLKVLFERVLDMELEEINEMFANNFVDVLVHPRWSLSFPFSSFADDLNTYRKLEFVPRTSEADENGDIDGEMTFENFDIVQLTDRVIDSTPHEDEMKDALKKTIRKLHENAQRYSQNNKR